MEELFLQSYDEEFFEGLSETEYNAFLIKFEIPISAYPYGEDISMLTIISIMQCAMDKFLPVSFI